jgi:ribosomal protein S18 acetylase RimI-like enzyme
VTGADDDLAARAAVVAVRTATVGDERRLTALDRATWSPAVAPGPLWDEDADFFAKDPPEDVLVAELDGEVVGYVRLRRPTDLPSHRHVRQVNGLAVDPAVRRRGVGRALLLAAIDEARRRGARRLTLQVLGTNPGALALYTGCGFEVEGVRRGEFHLDGQDVDDVLMAVHLGEQVAPRPPRSHRTPRDAGGRARDCTP